MNAADMLTKLPPKILRQICNLLPDKAALNLLLTCRHINLACDEWRVWRVWRDILADSPWGPIPPGLSVEQRVSESRLPLFPASAYGTAL